MQAPAAVVTSNEGKRAGWSQIGRGVFEGGRGARIGFEHQRFIAALGSAADCDHNEHYE